MSNRTIVVDVKTSEKPLPVVRGTAGPQRVLLYMDVDTGTWRLYLEPQEMNTVDLSLEELRALVAGLNGALADIDRDPQTFNAELQWKQLAESEDRPESEEECRIWLESADV